MNVIVELNSYKNNFHRYLTNLKEKRAHPGRVLTSKIENNLNERLRELSSQHSVITNTNSSNEDTSSSEMDTYENDIADETLVENSQQNNVVHSENLSEDILLLNLPNVATSIEELKEDILKLNAKADKILDILLNKVTVVKNTAFLNLHPDNPEVVEENIFPIKSLEALNTLNEKLSELNFFKSIIKQFDKEYIGTGYTWKKIAYLLIDKLIERQVLKLFTWTGSSKKQSIKFSFSALIHFNRLFYGIVKAGDQAYTQLNHEDFFKHSILKYSDARATAADKGLKRTSTPRVSVSRKKTTINLSLEDPIEVAQEDKENADLQDEDRISESE